MKKLLIIFIMLPSLMLVASCKTKKSVIEHKTDETEKVVIQDKSTEEKKVVETEAETKTDKSVIDEWMKIESDKIIITDKNGTVTEIINPKIEKGKSENNESVTNKDTTTETEENKRADVKTDVQTDKKSNTAEQHSSKSKEPIWLYVIGGLVVVVVICIVLKKFNFKII